MDLGLGRQDWGCGPNQICTNVECANIEYRLTLTYFMARTNLIPNAFIWENLKFVHFSITV